MFRQTIKELKAKGTDIKIVIKTKDVLETLVKNSGFEYENILPQGRSHNRLSILLAVFKRDIKLWKICRKFKPDIMIGTDPSIAHISWLTRKYGITIVEDDDDVIKSLVRLTYPFTKAILCPKVCRVGAKYEHKKLGYSGYMKLGYLHPNIFQLKDEVLKRYNLDENFVLIRLSSLGAYHDYGIKGLTKELLSDIIELCSKAGYQIRLSAEFEIAEEFRKYQLEIDIVDMHHILAGACMLISDSQSMSVEAAVLGIPSVRYSGFAGRISVLEELENKYQLTTGVPIGETDYLFETIHAYLTIPNLKELHQERRKKMLREKINVTAFLTWLLDKFPESIQTITADNNFEKQFIETFPNQVVTWKFR